MKRATIENIQGIVGIHKKGCSLTLDWSGVRKFFLKQAKTEKEIEISQIKGNDIPSRGNSMAKSRGKTEHCLGNEQFFSMPGRWCIRKQVGSQGAETILKGKQWPDHRWLCKELRSVYLF